MVPYLVIVEKESYKNCDIEGSMMGPFTFKGQAYHQL